MASFIPEHDEGVVAPTATGTSFGQTPNTRPVHWPTVAAMFKTSSEPSPGSAPLIAADTTLEQEKVTVLACWLAMGGK